MLAPIYIEGFMGFQKFEELEFRYYYDFSEHGGAASAITLTAVGNALESGLVVEDIQVFVSTAFDDAGNTATVTLGHAGDADGYMADFMTAAETANTIIRVGEQAGALMWDDTNDHMVSYRITSSANAIPLMTIGTEALTQGYATFIFKCRRYA